MKYMVLICVSLVLTSCGIGGQWMNGNPSAGKNIKPYIQHWVKNNMTEEGRRVDSWTCGAGATVYGADHVAFSKEQASEEKKPNEKDDIAARLRLEEKWKYCMRSMGYRHTTIKSK